MLRRIAQVVALIGVLSGSANGEESLCPPLKPLPEGVDDHRMRESDLTPTRFNQALAYFKGDLSRQLAEAKPTVEVTNREGFWIAYDNSLKVLEGYALRQTALLERTGKTASKGRAGQQHSGFVTSCRRPAILTSSGDAASANFGIQPTAFGRG